MSSIANLPAEVLHKIFQNLNWNDLKQCSSVCKAWEVVANQTTELKWKEECKKYFGQIYEEAFRKSRLSWEMLYKSLSLWHQVKSSRIYLHYSELLDGEDGYVPMDSDKPKRIQVLKNGVIAFPHYVQQGKERFIGRYGYNNSISYYDPETLLEIDRVVFNFEFYSYAENDDLIVAQISGIKKDDVDKENLCIITKANKQQHRVGTMVQYSWGDFSEFYLVGNKVFFITEDYKIWMSKLVYVNGEPTIQSAPFADYDLYPELHGIVAFTFINQNQVNILTNRGTIYSVVDQHLKKVDKVKKEMDNRHEVITTLERHGFDWSTSEVYKWICSYDIINNDWVAITHLKNAVVRSYDRVVFIGTSMRSLHVYYNPYRNGQLKLYHKQPTLKIDLNKFVPNGERDDESFGITPTQRKIMQIDVMEIPNGHRVILLFCQRLVAIEFHNDPPKRPGEPINLASRPRYAAYRRVA
ncbi:f-box-like domain-containing protein [Phthorimaea operculella]|nr:f-box-like domain-containing protein [Phthorimaea operculella]